MEYDDNLYKKQIRQNSLIKTKQNKNPKGTFLKL